MSPGPPQAVAWLRADLVYWGRQARSAGPRGRDLVRQTLLHWRDAPTWPAFGAWKP